jgi:hypothetical protein
MPTLAHLPTMLPRPGVLPLSSTLPTPIVTVPMLQCHCCPAAHPVTTHSPMPTPSLPSPTPLDTPHTYLPVPLHRRHHVNAPLTPSRPVVPIALLAPSLSKLHKLCTL